MRYGDHLPSIWASCCQFPKTILMQMKNFGASTDNTAMLPLEHFNVHHFKFVFKIRGPLSKNHVIYGG